MKFFTSICLALALLTSSGAQAETVTVDPKRTLKIEGTIGYSTTIQAKELLSLVNKGDDPIYLVINSPGGNVFAGLQFITIMNVAKNRGIEIHCVVPYMAASMAFQIFTECTHRYSFPYALLLWHPIRINFNGPLTPEEARELAKEMEYYERHLVSVLIRELGLSSETFYKHYYNETWHLGIALHFLTEDFLTLAYDLRGAPGLL